MARSGVVFPPAVHAKDAAVPSDRRIRKASRTRAALADAALRLFAEKGYENTSVEDIADVVDVGSRTFFRYFSSKEDVLFADLDTNDLFLEAIRQQPIRMSDLDAVREAYIALLPPPDPAVIERTVLMKKALESSPALQGRNVRLQIEFRDGIASALAARRGLKKPDGQTLMAAAIAQTVMHLTFDHWAALGGRPDIRKELRRFFGMAMHVLDEPRGSSGETRGRSRGAVRKSA